MQLPTGILCSLALLAGVFAPLAGPAVSGQAQQQQDIPTIRVGVSLVNLYATVRDKNKRIVNDLTKEDFRVLEDEKEQKIEFFSKETSLPITMGLLVDTSGSMQRMLPTEQDAGAAFLRKVMRKGDMAFVASFDKNTDLLADFSGDVEALERALYRARIVAYGPPPAVQGPFPLPQVGTVFYDAVYVSAKEKLAGEVGRKALVILTDAQDYGSKVKLEEALEAAQKTDTVVHILLISDPDFYGRAGASYSGAGAAKKLTEQTGGRLIEVRSEKKLEEAFEQISEELRSQYTLGYYPSNNKKDGSFRKLKLEVKRDGMKALARRGYYAPSK
jgi:VWFA-related protein